MHPFADVFDAATVVALAEPQVHARGEGYRRNGRVGPLTVCDGRLEATVRGTMPYVVELWAERGEPRWSCTCPAAEDGSFCKHCTAVALSMGSDDSPLVVPPLAPLARLVRAQASASGRRVDPAPAEDLASFVEEFAQDRLARIVLDHAATDWRLRERLLAEARAARGDGPDMGAWRRRIDNAFAPYGDFVTYREAHGWADGVKDVIDALADLCDAGQHDAAARLAEHAHRRADKAIDYVDDSDGRLSGISLRLSQVHHRACVEGRPDPVELAARLVDLELASELDGFYRAAAEYAEVLGEAGLAAYRERLEPQWKRIGHGAGDWPDNAFAVRQAMAGWAIGTGDPDALIEVHGRDRILPGNVLEIALALDAAGRSDEAMAWARRGIAEHGDSQWQAGNLREFLAGALRGRGEAQAAVELFWQAFVSHPSLATYRRLLDEAAEPRSGADKPEQPDNPEQSDKPEQPDNPEQSDKPAGWQQRCEEELRSRLSRLDGRVPGDRGASNAAVPRAAEALVEILAYEGRVEAAWNAATVHGCAERMWMTLARAREKTHPSDAMGVYEPRVLELINRKKTQAYRSAVDLMERIRHLADAANEPDRFRSLLERVRTEHRAKRNLKKLLDAKDW